MCLGVRSRFLAMALCDGVAVGDLVGVEAGGAGVLELRLLLVLSGVRVSGVAALVMWPGAGVEALGQPLPLQLALQGKHWEVLFVLTGFSACEATVTVGYACVAV